MLWWLRLASSLPLLLLVLLSLLLECCWNCQGG
jgi:hypothetical protein